MLSPTYSYRPIPLLVDTSNWAELYAITYRLVPYVSDDAGQQGRLASEQGHVAAALLVVEVRVAEVHRSNPGRA